MNTPDKVPLILGRYVNQQTLMKELHIGFDTLKMLHLNGLEAVIIGRQHLYDLEDLKNVLNQLKSAEHKQGIKTNIKILQTTKYPNPNNELGRKILYVSIF